MEYKRLGDICQFINGDRGVNYPKAGEYINDGIPFINAGHIGSKLIDFTDMNYISDEVYEKLGSGKLQKDDIVFCLRGSLGKSAIIDFVKGAIASSLVILRNLNKDKLDIQYLMFVLNSNMIKKQIDKANNGSSQPNLSASSVKDFEIALPKIEMQKKIAQTLITAQILIDKRKQQIEACDELIKSRFVEMFGDPVTNSKDLVEYTLPEVGEFGRGVSKHRPRNASELLGGKYPLIQTGDVANADLYITKYESTYSELGYEQSKMWNKGTLCITIAANIAKTAILSFDACFPDSVVGFCANEKTNNIYIHFWFSFFQSILEEQAPESAQKNINLKILSELKVIIPSIEEQNAFVDFIQQVNKLKFDLRKSLSELEDNFNTLIYRAFNGELF